MALSLKLKSSIATGGTILMTKPKPIAVDSTSSDNLPVSLAPEGFSKSKIAGSYKFVPTLDGNMLVFFLQEPTCDGCGSE